MKTNTITLPTGNIFDPKLEEMLQKKDSELKVTAEKNAKNFAQRNLPALAGDNLLNYTGEIKAGYEKLAAEVAHYLQPESHIPEAKIDASYYKEKVKNFDTDKNEKEAQNRQDENVLSDFVRNNVPSRILWAFVGTFLITLGEIMFNTKSFQVTGESLLFALGLSICVSFAVFLASHLVPLLYKSATNKIQRISVVLGSLSLVTCLFLALAIFRSSYLESHDVHIRPFYFVIINLFFFIVSALISFFVLPTWAEMKQNAVMLKVQYKVNKRKKEITKLQAEIDKIHTIIQETSKIRVRIAHLANYSIERIRKMYPETIGIFKTTNMTYRLDNTPPACFSEELPELAIENFIFSLIINTDKQ